MNVDVIKINFAALIGIVLGIILMAKGMMDIWVFIFVIVMTSDLSATFKAH